MAPIFQIAAATGALLGFAPAVMAQDAAMTGNAFGGIVPQYVEFCPLPPQFGEFHAPPNRPHALPPSVIMRSPEVPTFGWVGKHSSGRIFGDIICVP
jgi:hypothetical protein